MAMPGVTLANDLAVQDAQRRKKRRRAVALVIVRHGSAPALLDERQPRLGAIQRLNLALLVQTQHHRLLWGLKYNPTTSVSFSKNFASRESLNVRLRCGLILCNCHNRFTVALLTFCSLARVRQLQCVIPFGLVCKVALMMASRLAWS